MQKASNPLLGQCYPTSRVVRHFFPETEIVKGNVWKDKEIETHFWNVLKVKDDLYHIDLTWQQFPQGSKVCEYTILDRNKLGDSDLTGRRCEFLLGRVNNYLQSN